MPEGLNELREMLVELFYDMKDHGEEDTYFLIGSSENCIYLDIKDIEALKNLIYEETE